MDGKSVLLTHDDTLTPEDVGLGDKAMMRLAAGFRRMKTTGLRLRPVDHGTAHRITSHVQRCVLTLLLQRAAEIRTGETWRHIRLALEELKAVRYHVQGTTIGQTTRPTAQAMAYLKKLGVPPPKCLLSVDRSPTLPEATELHAYSAGPATPCFYASFRHVCTRFLKLGAEPATLRAAEGWHGPRGGR
jgi:hypothetical protein